MLKYNPYSKKYLELESKVANYTVPNPLMMKNGVLITDREKWFKEQRPNILRFFEEEIYGKSPEKPKELKFEVRESDNSALKGKATRKQIRLYPITESDAYHIDILIYIPNHVTRPVPTFLGLNFWGNHSVHSDPKIFFTESWMRNIRKAHVKNNKPTPRSRNAQGFRWEINYVLSQGYATATAFYGDIVPDRNDGLELGITAYYRKNKKDGMILDRSPNEWGAISAWAWGLSRIMDYIERDPDIDSKRVILHGHSRLGKTALWCGAQDPRFAIIISNCSGCLGAALKKRKFGETYSMINRNFPHWFSLNCRKYNNNEDLLPFDQHCLISLIAPRPVYIASASQDLGADPYGEFLSAKYASPVYQLLGTEGLDLTQILNKEGFPEIEHPIHSIIGHHIRDGKHNILLYDWKQYIQFANKHLYKSKYNDVLK